MTPHIKDSVHSSLGSSPGAAPKYSLPKSVAAQTTPIVAYKPTTVAPYIPVVRTKPAPKPVPKLIPIELKPIRKVPEPNDNFDLVGRIIGQLTPHIKQSVSSSLDVGSDAIDPRLRTIVQQPKSPNSDLHELKPVNPDHTYKANDKGLIKIVKSTPSQGYLPRRRVDKVNKISAEDSLIGKIVGDLTPQIKDSVSSIFNVAEDINRPDLASFVTGSKSTSGAAKGKNPVSPLSRTYSTDQTSSFNTYSFNNQAADDDLADDILSKLTPSIQTNVKSILDKNAFSYTDNVSDDKLADDILASLAPSIETNVKSILGTGNSELGSIVPKSLVVTKLNQVTEPSKTYSFETNNPTLDNEKIIESVIKQLSPQIQDSVTSIFTVAEDINHPELVDFKTGSKSRASVSKGSKPFRPLSRTYNGGKTSTLNTLSYANPSSDKSLADDILSKLTPSIQTSVQSILNQNNPSYTSQASDDKLADDILAKLTPSIENNVKNILGKNNDIVLGSKSKITNVYNSDKSSNPLQAYLIGIDESTQSNEKIIDTVIKQLSPQIEDSVASIFNVAEDINHPSLGKVIKNTGNNFKQSKETAPKYTYSYADNNSDEIIADEILAKLAPSVTSSVEGLLGISGNNGAFSIGGLDNTGGQIAKVSSKYPFKSYGSIADSSTKGNEDIVDSIIKNLSPQIKGSVDNIFNVAEDINHPHFGASVKDHLSHETKKSRSPLLTSGLGGSSDEQLADEILGNLTPFIKGSVGTYFSNQNRNEGYTNSDNENFTDDLIDELLPTIKTMVGSKFGGNKKKSTFFNF